MIKKQLGVCLLLFQFSATLGACCDSWCEESCWEWSCWDWLCCREENPVEPVAQPVVGPGLQQNPQAQPVAPELPHEPDPATPVVQPVSAHGGAPQQVDIGATGYEAPQVPAPALYDGGAMVPLPSPGQEHGGALVPVSQGSTALIPSQPIQQSPANLYQFNIQMVYNTNTTFIQPSNAPSAPIITPADEFVPNAEDGAKFLAISIHSDLYISSFSGVSGTEIPPFISNPYEKKLGSLKADEQGTFVLITGKDSTGEDMRWLITREFVKGQGSHYMKFIKLNENRMRVPVDRPEDSLNSMKELVASLNIESLDDVKEQAYNSQLECALFRDNPSTIVSEEALKNEADKTKTSGFLAVFDPSDPNNVSKKSLYRVAVVYSLDADPTIKVRKFDDSNNKKNKFPKKEEFLPIQDHKDLVAFEKFIKITNDAISGTSIHPLPFDSAKSALLGEKKGAKTLESVGVDDNNFGMLRYKKDEREYKILFQKASPQYVRLFKVTETGSIVAANGVEDAIASEDNLMRKFGLYYRSPVDGETDSYLYAQEIGHPTGRGIHTGKSQFTIFSETEIMNNDDFKQNKGDFYVLQMDQHDYFLNRIFYDHSNSRLYVKLAPRTSFPIRSSPELNKPIEEYRARQQALVAPTPS